jgi:hypothetical protein
MSLVQIFAAFVTAQSQFWKHNDIVSLSGSFGNDGTHFTGIGRFISPRGIKVDTGN